MSGYADASTYDGLVNVLAGLVVVSPSDPGFQAELPETITYANNRMCRDLDFLSTRQTQIAGSTTAGGRTITLAPENPIVVLEGINIVAENLITGYFTLNPLTRQTQAYMSLMYPLLNFTPTVPTVPVDFSDLDGTTILIGPAPDAIYSVSATGTVRPSPPSTANPTPWILQNLSDLFVTACMVRLSGWMKNYSGAMSDDPQQPMSWEMQYQALLKGASTEEARKLAQSASWSDQKPRQESTPPRQ